MLTLLIPDRPRVATTCLPLASPPELSQLGIATLVVEDSLVGSPHRVRAALGPRVVARSEEANAGSACPQVRRSRTLTANNTTVVKGPVAQILTH